MSAQRSRKKSIAALCASPTVLTAPRICASIAPIRDKNHGDSRCPATLTPALTP